MSEEQKGLRRRRVYVDDREAANHPMWMVDGPQAVNMPGSFAREGFVPIVARSDVGDFWVNLDVSRSGNPFEMPTQLVIESKTPDDLVNSLRDDGTSRDDSRIRHQLGGLLRKQAEGKAKNHIIIPVVMTVGTISLPGVKGGKNTGVMVEANGRRVRRKFSYYEVESAVAAVQRLGILHYRAPSSSHVPEALRHLAEVCEHSVHFEDPGLARVALLGPRLSMLATVLTAVEGIGPTTARMIATRYGTFQQFYEHGIVSDLVKVEGVGKLTASRLYDAFHSEHVETPDEIIANALARLT